MFPVFLTILIFVSLNFHLVLAGLEPEKIVDGGVYRLEIQSEDKFLTASENADVIAIRSRWASKPEQKWTFTSIQDSSTSGQQGWKLAPLNGKSGIPTVWKVSYVGHGKFRFTSYASGLCLAGEWGVSSFVGERKCEKDSPYQRWLVQAVRA